jgi:nicotinate phosphoribosyltransferase
MFGYHEANRKSLEDWIRVYNGDLGTVLPDTFTSKAFFNIFDTHFAKLFDGFRQDSGDPFIIGHLGLDNYYRTIHDKHIIQSKSVIFSNALDNLKSILEISDEFKKELITRFMIGTWLTCDIPIISDESKSVDFSTMEKIKPLNIVMKLSHVFIDGVWIPVVKLGDGSGEKYTGDPNQIDLAKRILNIK